MHDPRIGRFFAIDPLFAKYPHYTPYQFSGNKVIHKIELEGLEESEHKKNVTHVNMVKDDNGNLVPDDENAWSGSELEVKSENGYIRNIETGELVPIEIGNYGTQTTQTTIYTYWDKKGNITKQVIRSKGSTKMLNNATASAQNQAEGMIPDYIAAPINYATYESLKSAYLRSVYVSKVSALPNTDVGGRTQIKLDIRANTPPVMASLIENKRPSVASKSGSTTSANKSNPKVNSTAKWMGRLGTAGTVISVANSTYIVVNSDNKAAAIIEEGAKTVGSIQGGLVGGVAGAEFGVPGAIIGAVVGSIVGGEAVEAMIGPPLSDFEMKQRQDAYIKQLETDGVIVFCFIAGTKIPMADGTTKNIEDVIVGDIVLSVNTQTSKVENDTVYEIMSPMHKDLFTISFEHAENTNTGDHPYYIEDKGWASLQPNRTFERYGLSVGQLEVGDVGYFLVEGELINSRLIEINELDTNSVKTYNIKVRKNKNYLANGVLVHNKCCFKEGSMVSMKNGTLKPIEDVSIGDSILAFNISTKMYSNDIVTSISRRIHKELVRIEYSNGVIVTSTLDHPYYVEGKGWASFNPEKTLKDYDLNVSSLEIGDVCVHTDEDGSLSKVTIEKIGMVNEVSKTFNLSGLENGNTYFVNGILVTNER